MVGNKKAEAGIGTLILFIALILVAAVAAGVLISTASSLQSKALSTGSKAQTQVSTAAVINKMYATDGTSGSSLEHFFVDMKLAPGSDSIKFEDALGEFILSNGSQTLSYSSTGSICNNEGAAGAGSSNFRVEYLVNGTNQRIGYLQNGDVVRICFTSATNVTEDEEFRFAFTPKTGSISQIKVATPEIVTFEQVQLFP